VERNGLVEGDIIRNRVKNVCNAGSRKCNMCLRYLATVARHCG
jgi:hypothetical protein